MNFYIHALYTTFLLPWYGRGKVCHHVSYLALAAWVYTMYTICILYMLNHTVTEARVSYGRMGCVCLFLNFPLQHLFLLSNENTNTAPTPYPCPLVPNRLPYLARLCFFLLRPIALWRQHKKGSKRPLTGSSRGIFQGNFRPRLNLAGGADLYLCNQLLFSISLYAHIVAT